MFNRLAYNASQDSISGVGVFEGSGWVRASSSSVAAYPPPHLQRKFSPDFNVDSTRQLRGSGPLDPPSSYAAGLNNKQTELP